MIHYHPKTQLLITFAHVATFTFFFFLFFFLKKTLKLVRGPPCHMGKVGKVVKSCVLGWQNIIYFGLIKIHTHDLFIKAQ
jgi:hypothetical protein